MQVGILGILGCIFVTLKLCDVITWSWWLVTLPFWGGIVLGLAIFLVTFVITSITVVYKEYKKEEREKPWLVKELYYHTLLKSR